MKKNANNSKGVKVQNPIFKSSEGEAKYLAAYDVVLELWPVHHEAMDVPTRYGITHINACGPKDGFPLVLLPGQFGSSTMWFPNVGALSKEFRVLAVDTMGEPGRSIPCNPINNKNDYMYWLIDIFDKLEINKAIIGGLSYGGWLALNFTLTFPERIKSLVLLDPVSSFAPLSKQFILRMIVPFFISPTPKNLYKFSYWLLRGRMGDKRYQELFVAGLTGLKFGKRIPATVFKDRELCSVSRPTLLLLGEECVIYNFRCVMKRAKRLIPDIKAEIIPEASHSLNMEQAELVNQKIVEFLNDLK
jgi:pimeloyl-ACP methyl ester carboxylesterase